MIVQDFNLDTGNLDVLDVRYKVYKASQIIMNGKLLNLITVLLKVIY